MLDKFFKELAAAHGLAPAGDEKVVYPDAVTPLLEGGGTDVSAQYATGDVGALTDTFEKMVWVYRCVSIIATNIAMLPVKVFRLAKDGTKEDVSHLPEFQIFQKPNKHQTRFDFWMETISRLKLQGEFFWELEFSGRRHPVAVYADWRSENVRVITDPQEFIVAFERYVNSRRVRYPAEQVFFVKYFNPKNSYRGMSPLRAGRGPLTLELNAVEFNKRFFKQGMRPSGLVTLPREPSQTELDRLREQFYQLYAGTKKAHNVAFMWGGMEFQPLAGMNLTDAEFTVLRTMNREEIAALYGVPLEVLGIGKATYENWKEARKSFWQETLLPDIMKIYSLLNEHFLPRLTDRQDVVVEPDLSGVTVLKEDVDAKAKRYFDGFKHGAVTPNMILTQVFGGEPVDDPAMNSFYLPLNVQPVATAAKKGGKGTKKKTESKSVLGQLTVEERARHWWNIIKQVEPDERAFELLMVKFFKRQEKEVVARVLELQEKGVKVDLRVEGQIFDLDAWVEELQKLGGPALVERVRESMQMVMDETPDLLHPAVRGALGLRVSQFSQFVNETTARQIQDVLREALAEQLPIPEIAARVREQVFDPSVTARRAATIARTEIMGAHNFGLQHGMVQGGHQRKMWLTSRDDRVRETHRIDGQVVNVDENFVLLDGREMPFPQDFNERCTMIPTKAPRNRPGGGRTATPLSTLPTGPEFEKDLDVLRKLTEDEIKEARELGGGINKTLVLSDDVRGVFKPQSGETALRETAMKHEVAAYRIDRIFGFDFTPPTVIREHGGELGSHQLFMDGYEIIRGSKWAKKVSEVDKEKLTLFDWMLRNADRHGANLMVNSAGKLAAIDNGYTFSIPEFYTPFEKLGIPLQEMKFKRWFKKNFTFEKILRVKEEVFDQGLLSEQEFKGFLGRVWQVLDEESIPFDHSFGSRYFDNVSVDEALRVLKEMFEEFKL